MSIQTDVKSIVDDLIGITLKDEGISATVTYNSYAATPTLDTGTMKSTDTATTATMYGVWSTQTRRDGEGATNANRSIIIPAQDFTDASITPSLNDTLIVSSVTYRVDTIESGPIGTYFELGVVRQ